MNSIASEDLPKFSIGLVHYKTLELTKQCLELLEPYVTGQQMDHVDVWVVDNGSNDASTDYLRELSWINLIERQPESGELGYQAHGRGLDRILNSIESDYLFVIHTDTFIHNPDIFLKMIERCLKNQKIAAVGCVHQVHRGVVRLAWRTLTRCLKYYSRVIKSRLGIKTKPPKYFMERYLRSFCTLWNVSVIKQAGYSFAMGDRVPGYEMQDRLVKDGYTLVKLSSGWMFSFLDHLHGATVGLVSTGGSKKRRMLKEGRL